MNTSVLLHLNINVMSQSLPKLHRTARSFIQKVDNYYDVMERNQVGQLHSTI